MIDFIWLNNSGKVQQTVFDDGSKIITWCSLNKRFTKAIVDVAATSIKNRIK
ncbi:hypothetical protein O9992_28025 [Vibrio lentus]|nr:hypothetical protein [Vibrio lentus]